MERVGADKDHGYDTFCSLRTEDVTRTHVA
jgi:hypothetical protein